MPEPRSLEEWADLCRNSNHWIAWSAGQGGAHRIVCLDCAHAYAGREYQDGVETGKMMSWLDHDQTHGDMIPPCPPGFQPERCNACKDIEHRISEATMTLRAEVEQLRIQLAGGESKSG